MLYRTNLYIYHVVLNFISRYVFLHCRVRGARDDLFHLLSAAHNRNLGILYFCNDVSAIFADIILQFHNIIPPVRLVRVYFLYLPTPVFMMSATMYVLYYVIITFIYT